MTTGAGPRVRTLPMGVHGDQLAEMKAAELRAAGLPEPAKRKGGWRTRCRICSRLHKPGECRQRDDDDVAAASAENAPLQVGEITTPVTPAPSSRRHRPKSERRSGGTGARSGPRTEAPGVAPSNTTTEGERVKKSAKKERACGSCGGVGHRRDSPECPEYKGRSGTPLPRGGGKGVQTSTSLRPLIEKIVDERLEQKLRELFA